MFKILAMFFFFINFFSIELRSSFDILEKTELELYEEAITLFNSNQYKQTIRIANKIEDLYPLSYSAMNAQLLSGVSNYNIGDYNSAGNIISNFIDMYPKSEQISYAYYLRILSYYMQIKKIKLEQGTAYKTLELANEYVNLFPDNKYVDDVKEKLVLIKQHIRISEFSIGKFYFKRGEYLAAIKRFQSIVNNYQDSKEDCPSKLLHYLVKSYIALGITLEAKQYASLCTEDNT
ncbi:outer membrane protein assembly factor BamD [Wolbachia endosymbiont of Pentidionis agamae]|uniref:outer membrane protein assembly factor BamD n=1 Tax=Wolbachia endosymbiont of Pentidionis agamae TaxID=3110435 RepID=UPI002FCFAC19